MGAFPQSWWRKKRPLIMGHRGASHIAPQNTLAAFRAAVELGADGVELDVQLTVDGIPVVIHNATVDATSNGQGCVSALSLAQLQTLDAGNWFDSRFAGERIPTLGAVLAALPPDFLINIEIKSIGRRDAALEMAVAAAVQKADAQRRVWFSSFKPYSLFLMRQLLPGAPCGLLYDRSSITSLLLRPFTPCDALHPYHGDLTPQRVLQMHRAGLRVGVWTVDDPARARLLADWGVDIIISNEPDRLLAAFAEESK